MEEYTRHIFLHCNGYKRAELTYLSYRRKVRPIVCTFEDHRLEELGCACNDPVLMAAAVKAAGEHGGLKTISDDQETSRTHLHWMHLHTRFPR